MPTATTATLNGALSVSATTVAIDATQAPLFPGANGYTIAIDGEEMTVTAGAGTASLTVTRGVNGTTAAAHYSGATVVVLGGALQGNYNAMDTLQNAATADGNGSVSNTSGYETLQLEIKNGAGTCTVTIQGSDDPAFTNAQDALTLGVVKLSDSTAGTNTSRSVISGAIAVAANTSYLYEIYDVLPNIRAVISAASGLGAGSTDTGCTVRLYKLAV